MDCKLQLMVNKISIQAQICRKKKIYYDEMKQQLKQQRQLNKIKSFFSSLLSSLFIAVYFQCQVQCAAFDRS